MMKPIAYVSDENYLAIADVKAELESLENGAICFWNPLRGALFTAISAVAAIA